MGGSLTFVNKRNRKFDFFQCKIKFYFTHEHQNLHFHSWLPQLVKILLLVFVWRNKIRFYTKIIKYRLCIGYNSEKTCSYMGRVKRIWFLSPMRAAKVQASLRIHAASPEPPLLAHISSESRGTFKQKARSLAPLNGCACAVKICHDGMLEDTNSLGMPHVEYILKGRFSVSDWENDKTNKENMTC